MRRFSHDQSLFRRKRSGASIVEYALLLALIAAVTLIAITALGTKLSDAFATMAATI